MNYYNECPNCGAHLDPGERCDCNTSDLYTQIAGQIEKTAKETGVTVEKSMDRYLDLIAYAINYGTENCLTPFEAMEILTQPEELSTMRRKLAEKWNKEDAKHEQIL